MKIIENWLSKQLAEEVRNYVLFSPYRYVSTSFYGGDLRLKKPKGVNTFFECGFNLKTDKIIRGLCAYLGRCFDYDIKVIRVYANLQFNGMDGSWHYDDGETTCLWMATPSLPKGSGTLQFNKKRKDIKFEFNKLIIFDAKRPHRGLAPKELNTPRITLAFKTTRA